MMTRRLRSTCAFLDQVTWVLGMFLLAIMSALVIGEVGMRYAFGSSTTWVEELTRYLMVWMTMLAASSAIRRAELIGVTLLVDRLSPIKRRVVMSVAHCLVLAFLCLVVYHGINLVERSFVLSAPALRIPMAWVYLAVPVGGILMIIQTIGVLLAPPKPPALGADAELTLHTA